MSQPKREHILYNMEEKERTTAKNSKNETQPTSKSENDRSELEKYEGWLIKLGKIRKNWKKRW